MALKYRLNTLGWYNFEVLIQTLLKVIIGPGVSSFGGTKDGGRDATFKGKAPFPNKNTKWEGEWVFQVKFSDFEAINEEKEGIRILNEFKNEIEKIKLRHRKWPDNYILFTNLRLTADFRKKLNDLIIRNDFKGKFHSIDGREVCELLDIYPDIRRSFPQLLGLADIDTIINRDIYNRSQAFVADWQPKLAVFVTVKPYFEAHEKIRKHDFVVIDGPPEVGKSFIGAAITFVYACDGFRIFYIQEPKEIFRIYDSSQKQLYFADDAVGTISFDPSLGDYWSRELPGILRKLDSHHKLVWTTRSYILQEAITATKIQEQIDNFPGIREVLVEISEFTLFEKALILYNHAKNSGLHRIARDLIKEYALFICRHPNFTPERVRQLVQIVLPKIKKELSSEEKQEWSKEISKFFANPSERFCRAYNALGVSEKIMLLSLFDLGDDVEIENLRKAYERRISIL